MKTYQRTNNYVEDVVDEQPVLMPTKESGKNEIIYCNDTGIEIYRYLDIPRTKDEIDKYIMELYECSDKEICQDNEEFLQLLLEKEAIK